MFKRRSGGIFLSAVALCCLTWLSTVEILRDIEIPKWGLADFMHQRIWAYTIDNRLTLIEANVGLAKELQRFREAMRPFVKSQACKIYVGGK